LYWLTPPPPPRSTSVTGVAVASVTGRALPAHAAWPGQINFLISFEQALCVEQIVVTGAV
jgi:hypothetical protein